MVQTTRRLVPDTLLSRTSRCAWTTARHLDVGVAACIIPANFLVKPAFSHLLFLPATARALSYLPPSDVRRAFWLHGDTSSTYYLFVNSTGLHLLRCASNILLPSLPLPWAASPPRQHACLEQARAQPHQVSILLGTGGFSSSDILRQTGRGRAERGRKDARQRSACDAATNAPRAPT